jgi:predicted P-loop ATPase
VPYAVHPKRSPIRGVAFGTVNGTNFLKDRTGNRRTPTFEVINTNHVTWDDYEKQQLFAQIWSYYIDGESWWFTDENEALIAEECLMFMSEDVIETKLESYIDSLTHSFDMTTSEIVSAVYGVGYDNDQSMITRAGQALKRMGYSNTKKTRDGKQRSLYTIGKEKGDV